MNREREVDEEVVWRKCKGFEVGIDLVNWRNYMG